MSCINRTLYFQWWDSVSSLINKIQKDWCDCITEIKIVKIPEMVSYFKTGRWKINNYKRYSIEIRSAFLFPWKKSRSSTTAVSPSSLESPWASPIPSIWSGSACRPHPSSSSKPKSLNPTAASPNVLKPSTNRKASKLSGKAIPQTFSGTTQMSQWISSSKISFKNPWTKFVAQEVEKNKWWWIHCQAL